MIQILEGKTSHAFSSPVVELRGSGGFSDLMTQLCGSANLNPNSTPKAKKAFSKMHLAPRGCNGESWKCHWVPVSLVTPLYSASIKHEWRGGREEMLVHTFCFMTLKRVLGDSFRCTWPAFFCDEVNKEVKLNTMGIKLKDHPFPNYHFFSYSKQWAMFLGANSPRVVDDMKACVKHCQRFPNFKTQLEGQKLHCYLRCL